MFDAAAQLFQDRHRASDIGLRAADQTEQLALLRRAGAAANRTFDEGAPCCVTAVPLDFIVSGRTVLMSITSLPASFAFRMPFGAR